MAQLQREKRQGKADAASAASGEEDRVDALEYCRRQMVENDIDLYFMTSSDEQMNRRPTRFNQRLKRLTGYTGMALAIVGREEGRAHLWNMDRRRAEMYIHTDKWGVTNLQIDLPNTGSFDKDVFDKPPSVEEWLGKYGKDGMRVGINPLTTTIGEMQSLAETLNGFENCQILFVEDDLLPPSLAEETPVDPIHCIPPGYIRATPADHIARIHQIMNGSASLMLLTDPEEISFYLNVRATDFEQLPGVRHGFYGYMVISHPTTGTSDHPPARLYVAPERLDEEAKAYLSAYGVEARPYDPLVGDLRPLLQQQVETRLWIPPDSNMAIYRSLLGLADTPEASVSDVAETINNPPSPRITIRPSPGLHLPDVASKAYGRADLSSPFYQTYTPKRVDGQGPLAGELSPLSPSVIAGVTTLSKEEREKKLQELIETKREVRGETKTTTTTTTAQKRALAQASSQSRLHPDESATSLPSWSRLLGGALPSRDDQEDELENEISKYILDYRRPTEELSEIGDDDREDGGPDGALPRVKWRDVVGLDDVKRSLLELIVLPALNPSLFTGLRTPSRGLLLFGPPGNGKTFAAKAVAAQCNSTFFLVDAASLTSKWYGESEKLVRALFRVARARSPSIIFLDELDSLLSARDTGDRGVSRRMKSEFLVQLDGVTAGNDPSDARVQFIGATNRPMDLDEALLRRLPKRLMVPLPDDRGREALVRKLLREHPEGHALADSDFNFLALETDGYSYSDITQLCREASLAPVRDALMTSVDLDAGLDGAHQEAISSLSGADLRPLRMGDLLAAKERIRATTSEDTVRELREWDAKFGASRM